MTTSDAVRSTPRSSLPRTLARIALGVFLLFAGIGHLSFARDAFQAQVPVWLPVDADFVVLASGVVEILLGLALLFLTRWRVGVGAGIADDSRHPDVHRRWQADGE